MCQRLRPSGGRRAAAEAHCAARIPAGWPGDAPGSDLESSEGTDSGSGASSALGPISDAGVVSGSGSGAGTNPGSGPDAGANADAVPSPEHGSGADASPVSGAVAKSGRNPGPDGGPGASSAAPSKAGSAADSGPGAYDDSQLIISAQVLGLLPIGGVRLPWLLHAPGCSADVAPNTTNARRSLFVYSILNTPHLRL